MATQVQMDQDAINLAKAIRQTESGGDFSINLPGGRKVKNSGEKGAYQWMPDTWKSHAKKILGNENADMSPSNQNAVAYAMIKQWKDQGYNPAQIAATWNSGSPTGWEKKIGTNKYGAQYNVPMYVKKVTGEYQKIKGVPGINTAQAAEQTGPQEPEKKSVGGFAKNVVKSAGGLLGSLGHMIMHPVETVKNVGGAAIGAGELLIPGEQGQEDKARAVGSFFKERYGSGEAIKNTLYNDPVGAAVDASALFTGGGTIAAKTGLIGKASKIADVTKAAGAVTKAERAASIAEASKLGELGTLAKYGEASKTLGGLIDPLRIGSKIASKAVSPITSRVGAIPEKFLATELKLNPSDVRRIALSNVAGVSPYQWLKENQVFGSRQQIIEKLEAIRRESKGMVDTSLGNIKATFQGTQIPGFEEVLGQIGENFGKFAGNESTVAAVEGLLQKAKTGQLTLSDVNAAKRLMDDTVRMYNRSGGIADTAQARGMANIRDKIKTFIEKEAEKNGVPNIRELNKRTQISEEIRRSALKRELGQEANRIIGLTDFITFAGFGLGGMDAGITSVIGKRILESSQVKMFIARRLAALGKPAIEGVEQAARTGRPTEPLRKIIREAMSYAKKNPAVLAEAGIQGENIQNQQQPTTLPQMLAAPRTP